MDQITKYFIAEKNESLLFIIIGIISIGIASYFVLKIKEPFYIGVAYPLIAIALLQLTVGFSVYFRSPKDILRVTEIVQTQKEKS